MLKKSVLFAVLNGLVLFPILVNAQANGDYRSAATPVNWGVNTSWEKYAGGWGLSADYPGQNAGAGTVTILDGHTITLNVSPANAIGALTVGEGASGSLVGDATTTRTLNVTNDLTVAASGSFNLNRTTLTINGNTSISGSLSDANNAGSAIFVGSFTVNNGGTFSTANTSAFTFRGGITNDGTFSKTGTGSVTFSVNNQAIGGGTTITMSGVVTVTGITVTNNHTDLNLTSTSANALTGTGGWTQGTNSVLKFSGASMNITTSDFDTNVNTVNYTRGGVQTVLSETYHHLTVSTSGTKTLGGAVTVNGNLSLTGSAVIACDIYQITGNGSGTFTMASGTGLTLGNIGNAADVLFPTNFTAGNTTLNSASTVTYQNSATQTVSNTPTYGNLTVSTGGTKTINGNTTIGGNLTVSSGTFDLGTTATSFSVTGTAAITGTLSFNGTSTKTLSITGNLSGAGTIDMSGGSLLHNLSLSGATNAITTLTTAAVASTITYGASGNQTVFASANYRNMVISGTGIKTIQGTIVINNDLTISSGTELQPAAQNLTVSGSSTISGLLSDNSATGTTNLQDVDLSGGSIIGSATGVMNINGNLSMPTGNGIIGRMTLTISGTTTIATGRSLTLNSNTGIKTFIGSVTINGTGTWTSTTITTTANLEFRGGITNNNAAGSSFSAGAATFTTFDQNLSGGGSFSFANALVVSGAITLTNQISNPSGITFTSTIDGTVAGSTWKNDPSTYVYYQSATQPMNTGTLNVSAIGNTFNYSLNNTQTVKGVTYHHLIISGGAGTKSLGGNASVDGDFTIAASTSFNPAGFDFTVTGSSTINGTFADAIVAGTTSLQNVDLSGGTINGTLTGLVNLNNLTMPTGNGIIGRVDLTVNGTTTVATGRSLTLNSNTGVKTFGGSVTINGTGTWTSTTITTAANLEFRAGITNNNSTGGSFAAGAATFSTIDQNLAGAGDYSFTSPVVISGAITLTNQSSNPNGITFTSTIDGTVGGSTFKNDPNTYVYYQSATQPMNTGTLNVSSNGNTFNYSRNNTQTVKGVTYYHLIISGGAGTKSLGATVAANGDFTIAASTSFNPAGFDFTVTGSSAINGTFADATLAGTSSLQDVDLSGGTINGGANGVVNINGNLSMPTGNGIIGRVASTVSGTTTVATGRSLTLNNNNGVKIFIGAITVNGTGTWTSTTVATTANLEIRGGITNNNSSITFSAGAATFSTNNQSLAGAGAYSFGNAVSITGAFTITNQSSHSSGVTFNNTITGTDVAATWRNDPNTVTYYQPGANTQPMNTGVLDVSASGNSFYYSRAGAQNIKIPLANYYHLYITGGGVSTKTMQANTVCDGNLSIASSTTLALSTFGLTVTGTSTVDGTLSDANTLGTNMFTGLLTISSTGSLSTTFNSPFVFEGGITNDGTFSKTGTGSVSFNTNNQDISGTAAMTMAGTVTIAANKTITYKNTSAGGITLSGILDGANASSTWKNDVNSTVYYQPAFTTQPMNTGILDVSATGNNFYYSRTTGAQTLKTPLAGYYNLIINGGGGIIKTLSGNTTVLGNLTIAASTTLDVDVAQNYSMTLKGNLVNSGTFQARSGTVTMNGNSDQAVTSNASTFYNLVIDNQATQVSLNDNLTVSNLLTLTNGVITTGANRVIISNSSFSSLGGYSSGSFVNGNLRRNIGSNTDTYVFPVGNGTGAANYFRADMINNGLVGITYIDSRFKPLTGHNDNEMSVSDIWEHGSLVYNTINTAGVWELEPNAAPSGGTYSVKLYIANMDGLIDNEFGPLKRPVGSTTGADWSTGGGTLNNNDSPGRTVSDGYMQRSGLSAFSEFGGGGGAGGGAGLPIELVSFAATLIGNEVKIDWATATETNNDFFTLERSQDAETFETLGVFQAAGHSEQERLYSTTDKNPITGISYYRLKQTDFDGYYSYSIVVAISFNETESTVTVSPNPVINRQLNITTNGNLDELESASASTFTLSDLLGRQLFIHNIESISHDIESIKLPMSIPGGWYIAKLKYADTVRSWKLMIE